MITLQEEVRSEAFAVGDAPAPSAAPAESREPSVAASAAGGRARTRSPRRHDYGGGRTFQEAANDRIRHLRQCDEAIEQQLRNLEQQFTGFPAERLRNWRDQDGRGFDPTRPMPVDATRTECMVLGSLARPDTSNGSLRARYRLSSRISPTGRSWLLILWNKSHGSLEGGRNTAKPATAAGIGPTKCIRHRKVLRVLRAQCRTGVH